MLQKGHDENLKYVKITFFPRVSDMLNVEPDIDGKVKSATSSPACNRVMKGAKV